MNRLVKALVLMIPILAGTSAITIGPAHAATVQVTNCNDGGVGSLRAVVSTASSGDTIDMRNLTCKLVTLTSGAIAIQQDDLVIRGPGLSRLAISGNRANSVFRHAGAGTLSLRGMTIQHGKINAVDAKGGCVYSAGSVNLYDVKIWHCGAFGAAGTAGGVGGGMYVSGDLTLNYSGLHSNSAIAGGGALVLGNLVAHRARIVANVARGRSGQGGGFRVMGNAAITYSTVAGNVSGWNGGGGQAFSAVYIANTTFSGNSAAEQGGGLVTSNSNEKTIVNSTFSGNIAEVISAAQLTPPASIVNSTFAFNRETGSAFSCLAAVLVWGEINVESSIVARNSCGDAQGRDFTWVTQGYGSVVGADNIIESAFIPLPADTIDADPMLLPLADNGGRTLTHALQSGSPAINQGNNVAGLANDQRGSGFPRVVNGRADIGAYERAP